MHRLSCFPALLTVLQSFWPVWPTVLSVAGVAFFMFGCTPTLISRGAPLTAEMLARIQHGTQTRDNVRAILGAPSFTATFGEEIWYYIWSREMQFAFHLPEDLDRKVVAIYFNSVDVVRSVSTYSLDDANIVKLVKRATPTIGKKTSLFKQLIGNIGRFSRPRRHVEY